MEGGRKGREEGGKEWRSQGRREGVEEGGSRVVEQSCHDIKFGNFRKACLHSGKVCHIIREGWLIARGRLVAIA